MDKAQIYPRK